MNYFIIPGLKYRSEIQTRVLKPEMIIQLVCGFYKTNFDEICKMCRKRELVEPRMVAMYLIKKYTKMGLRLIGELFGGRDHTTVIYAVQRISEMIDTNDRIKRDIERIEVIIL